MNAFSVPYFMGERIPDLEMPGAHVTVSAESEAGSAQELMGVLYGRLADLVERAGSPFVYAGDCVAPIGVLAGLQRRDVFPTLVWLDAHGDFNTWETTPSGFLGGMPLAMLTGRGEQTIVDAVGLAPLPDDRVWLVGARDLDPGEDEAVARSGMEVLDVRDLTGRELPTGPVHVHVDVDVVDPSDMPAVNYPAPGGPSLDVVVEAMTRLAEADVVAFSLSAWNPRLPDADRAMAASHRIARPFFG